MNASDTPSKAQRIAGHVLSSLVALALVASSLGKLMHAGGVKDGFAHFGLSESLITPLGVVELVSAVLSVIPKTRFWGVILITGYMGGAMVTHLRLGEPWFMQLAFGIVAWLGLALRDKRIRDLALHSPG
jgi:hypothetical protein